MSAHILTELKKLQRQRSANPQFATPIDLANWADLVIPLLSFDKKLQSSFSHNVAVAKMNYTGDNTDGVNESIGILNQAILGLQATLLENDSISAAITNEKVLQPPLKFTVKWVYEHAPLSAYLTFFGLLLGAFVSGWSLNKILTNTPRIALSAKPPTTDQPMNTIIPLTIPNAASSQLAASSVIATPIVSSASKK